MVASRWRGAGRADARLFFGRAERSPLLDDRAGGGAGTFARLDFFDAGGRLVARSAPPLLARLGRALDLARLFDLPDEHPDRMIAASIVLYVGLGIIAITMWNHWKPGGFASPIGFLEGLTDGSNVVLEMIMGITASSCASQSPGFVELTEA